MILDTIRLTAIHVYIQLNVFYTNPDQLSAAAAGCFLDVL